MSIDKHADFSLSQKGTLIFQRIAETPQPKLPKTPRTPKKTRLEQLPVSETPTLMMRTTTAVMRAIKRVPVERLPEYFEQTCDWRQHETAVICGSSQLTYQELDQRANRLAHFLISCGVGEGHPIGLLLEHSLDTYIALLGVLKAGAAFVPLDPSFHADWLAFIAQDAGLQGLVTTSAFREKTSALPCPVLELDQAQEVLSVQPETRPQVRVNPASLCYIIYTLGNTSRPKGVVFSHASIVNFLRVATPIYGVRHNDRVYQGMSIALDFSLEEIWPTWIAGATLVAGPTDSQHLGHGLTEFLVKHKITVLCCVPMMLATIKSDVPSLRSLLVVGDTCPAYLVSRWACFGRRMLNMYGPTETTVTATWCELLPGNPVTIGFPLPTYHVYILDNQLRLVEDGESGEICIGGPGVAIGYLNRPDLTQERFIPNPIWHEREIVPRLYRTGDLGRITRSGEIEYLGRIDNQTKIRGYHTELGKIEQTLLETGATVELEAETLRLRNQSSTPQKNLSIIQLLFHNPLFSDRYFRYNLLMFATNILAGIFAYLLHPSLAHIMGIQGYGQVAALVALSLVLVTPTQIVSTVAAKYASSLSISGDYAQLNGFIRRLTGILLAVGVGVTAVFVAASSYVAFFFHLNSPQSVILLGIGFIVSFAFPLNQGVLQGLQRFEWFAVVTLLSSLLRLVLVVGFVFMGFGINGAIFGITISTLLTYLITFQPLWKLLRGPLAYSGSLKSLWSYAILAATTAGGIVVLYSVDTVLAGHFLSTDETGLYGALATIGRTVLFVTSSVATVMFPKVVALHEQGKPHRRVVAQAVLGTVVLSGAVEVVFFLAPSLITKILFGQAFIAVAGLLPLYGLAMVLLSVAQVLLMYFLAIGNRIIMLIILLACLLQTCLIIWHHTSIAQIVQAVLITDVVLVLALLVTWAMTCYGDIPHKTALPLAI